MTSRRSILYKLTRIEDHYEIQVSLTRDTVLLLYSLMLENRNSFELGQVSSFEKIVKNPLGQESE